MDKNQSAPFEDRLANLLEDEWLTAAQMQRLSGGDVQDVIKALDRMWEAGRIDRETREIDIGAKRKGGGARFRRLRYRRKSGG